LQNRDFRVILSLVVNWLESPAAADCRVNFGIRSLAAIQPARESQHMSNPNEGTGSWKTLPPNHQAAYRPQAAREWRYTGGDSDDSPFSRMPLWARRFIGGLVTVCLGGAIAILLLFRIGNPARVPDFRVIGISSYNAAGIPPNAFGLEDAEAFVTSHAATFVPDQLTGSGLRLTLEDFANGSAADGNLIVLLNLHGLVAMRDNDQPRALFLALDATSDSPFQSASGEIDSSSPIIELTEVLASLQKSPASNVLLLIDAGRLGPNWRLGHLSNDLPTQLRSEIEGQDLGNLHVIVSTDAGQASWTIEQQRRSVFSHFVLEGLAGAADGWHATESSAIRNDATTNRRISCSELFYYLSHHIKQWAQHNRGATQSVVWLRAQSAAPDFDLIAVRDSKQPETDTTEAPSAESADPTSEQTAATETEAKSEKSGQAADEKTAATAKQPSAKSADTDLGAETSGGTAAASPAPTAEELNAAFERLDQLWQQRDILRQADHAPLFGPRSWRALQTHLLQSEKLLLCQADAANPMQRASDLLAAITALVSGEPVYSKLGQSNRSSIPVLRLTLPGSQRLEESRRQTIRMLCDAAWKLDDAAILKPKTKPETKPETKPGEPAPAAAEPKPEAAAGEQTTKLLTRQDAIAELVEQLKDASHRQAARLEIAERLVGLVAASTQLSQQQLRKCRSILALIPEPDLPSELTSLKRLADTALRSGELGIGWDSEFAKLGRDAVVLRVELEAFAAKNSDLLPRLGDDLKQALQHATAVERWLEHGGGDHARAHLEQATTFQQTLVRNETLIRQAVILRAKLMTEIPDFARWVANRMETDPARCQQSTLSQPARELKNTRGRFPDLDLSPLKEQQEKNLLSLVLGVRELNRLLNSSAHDPKTLSALTDTCKTLNDEYTAFRTTFEKHVNDLNLLALDDVAAAQWRQIHLLLEVPWISSNSRRELRKRLRGLASSATAATAATAPASTSGGAEPDQAELSGVWQAFWAIQTLSLAVPSSTPATAIAIATADRDEAPVELDLLWQLWEEFVNFEAVGDQQRAHAAMIARLRLGREVNRGWRRIAALLHDPSPEATSEQARQQALLVRSLDGADAPDPGLEHTDSIVQVRRVRTTQELLDRRRKWWRAQQAPGWLENWLPRRIDCAVKTSPSESGHAIRLSIPDQAFDGNWTLAFECSDKIGTFLNGKRVTEPLSINRETLDGLRIRLDSNAGYSRKWLTIALLDTAQFPVALDRIPVLPPFDPNKWRIVFLADGESPAYLLGQRSGRNELVTTSSGTPVSILRLPPSPDPANEPTPETAKGPGDPKDKPAGKPEAADPRVHQLTPFLVRPENDDSKSVAIVVSRRTGDGKRLELLRGDFALNPTDRLIRLAFKTPEDAPLPKSDLTNGLIFELELRGNAESKRVSYRIQPDFWHPVDFLRVSDVRFEKLRLSLELGQQFGTDPQLPRNLDVELCLPPELKSLAKESYLKARVGSQGETLFAEFDPADLASLQGAWTVSLKVAGFPRAFAWTLRHGSPQPARPPGLRILAPEDGPAFEKDKPGRLVIDVNSPELQQHIRRDPWKLDTGWRIRYEFVPGDRKLASRSGEIALRDSLRKQFDLLGLTKTGSWQLRGQVSDHDIVSADDTRFPNRSGRYSLRAVLESGNRVVARSTSMEIGIDTAGSKPSVRFASPASRFEMGPDLSIEVTCRDAESGISQLVVGFDKDKDGKLNDQEILADAGQRLAGPAILAAAPRFTLTLPKSQLPGVGKHLLLVRATNGINIPSDFAQHTITFALAKGLVILKGKKTRASRKLTLKGPGGYSSDFTVGRSAVNAKNSDEVVAGDYTITDVKTGKTWTTTVKPREKLVVTIDFSTNMKSESRSR